MVFCKRNIKPAVAAAFFGIATVVASPIGAADLGRLYDQLEQADPQDARRIAAEIQRAWGLSGSPAMDMLLKRGEDALNAKRFDEAIGHLTALTDHAPDFAHGWYMRAQAFFADERPGQALADLERALALEPRHFDAIYGLGAVMEVLDRPDLAYRAYAEADAIHPFHEDVSKALERLKPRVGGAEL